MCGNEGVGLGHDDKVWEIARRQGDGGGMLWRSQIIFPATYPVPT